MGKLLVKLLDPNAIPPTVAHPGEDLGFDIYALEDTFLERGKPTKVKTGIAAVYVDSQPNSAMWLGPPHYGADLTRKYGLRVCDRSSMATKNGIETMAGVIDAGYRGELVIALNLVGPALHLHPDVLRNEIHAHTTSKATGAADRLARVMRLVPETGWTPEFLESITYADRELISHWRATTRSGYQIKAGDKIAQLVPQEVLTGPVEAMDELPGASRGDRGFGSSGR